MSEMEEETKECLVCGTNAQITDIPDSRKVKIECERCGVFLITYEAGTHYCTSILNETSALISYWIRKNQSDKPIELTSETMKYIIENVTFPSVKEQADILILWMGDFAKSKSPDYLIPLKMGALSSIIGAKNSRTITYIAKSLVGKGILRVAFDSGGNSAVEITYDGWLYYEQLKRVAPLSRLTFMAMQYNNETLQRIYKEIIVDAVKQTGFDIRKLDDVKRAGLIDDKLRVEIRLSKFVIADLSDENRGAYWEAGFAEGLGKTVIYICEEKKFDKLSTHFDTNHNLTVKWKDDDEGLKKFADELKATIRATFPAEAKMED